VRERRKAHRATRRRAGFGPKPYKPRKPKAGGLAGLKELWADPVPRTGYLLERLVAALHGAAGDDVTVTWNDHINGRQFDSTLRFKKAYYSKGSGPAPYGGVSGSVGHNGSTTKPIVERVYPDNLRRMTQ
jgi:hypothetical protein